MNINLTAHDILGHLSKNKWRTEKMGDGSRTYKLLFYEWETLETICKFFPKNDTREIKYSIEELIKNGHVEKDKDYWSNVRATEPGEIAFEKGFYIKSDKNEKAEQSDNFFKRYWYAWPVIAFIIGNLITPVFQDYIKNRQHNREESTIEKKHQRDSSNHNDSTTTEKK
jgi:hypothetical protein